MITPGRLFRLVVDAVLPPLCLSCQGPVSDPGSLCPACWPRLAFVERPFCQACGLPFELPMGDGAICADCAAGPPRYGRARAVFRYDDASRGLILRLKHGDRLEGVPAFARWMARAGEEILLPDCLLVPVPLHRWRLLLRRYNQAALLASGVAKAVGLEAAPCLLERSRRTSPQGHLGHDARRRNVAGAFRVAPSQAGRLKGRAVVLVDDVLTTGATVEECARVMLKAGAASVDVLTLGRVVRQD